MIMFTNVHPTSLDVAALKWVMRQKSIFKMAFVRFPLPLKYFCLVKRFLDGTFSILLFTVQSIQKVFSGSGRATRRWPMYFSMRWSLPVWPEPDNTFWADSTLPLGCESLMIYFFRIILWYTINLFLYCFSFTASSRTAPSNGIFDILCYFWEKRSNSWVLLLPCQRKYWNGAKKIGDKTRLCL